MAQVKNSMGSISPAVLPATAVAIPAADVESQSTEQEKTAVEDENDRMGAGTVVFVLILMSIGGSIIGTISTALYNDVEKTTGVLITPTSGLVLAVVSGVCLFAAAVIVASLLTCGCRSTHGRYEPKSRVGAWAMATLVALCLALALQIVGRLLFVKSTIGLVMYCAIESAILILALVFARLFARGG